MKTTNDKSKYQKKLIDIPKEILVDLKKLAIDDDKTLKAFIENVLVDLVHFHNGKSTRKSSSDP